MLRCGTAVWGPRWPEPGGRVGVSIDCALGIAPWKAKTLGRWPRVSARWSPPTRLPLPGTLLRQLLESKYGKAHDCAFVKRDIPGKTLVSLNILYHHYGMRRCAACLWGWEGSPMQELSPAAHCSSAGLLPHSSSTGETGAGDDRDSCRRPRLLQLPHVGG